MSTTSSSGQNAHIPTKYKLTRTSAWSHNARMTTDAFFGFILRRSSKLTPDEEEAGILLRTEPYRGEARDALIDALAGTSMQEDRKIVEVYAGPQLAFITSQFRLFDDQLLQLLGEETSAYSSNNLPSFPFICKFLTGIVHVIKTKDAPTLNTVKTHLEQQSLMKTSIAGNAVYQLLFAAFGLVTAFFTPSLTPKPNCLQLAEPNNPGASGLRRAGTWHSNSKDIDENILEISLCDLLFRFSQSNEGPIPRPISRGTKALPLLSSNLSYYTLAELAGLQIDWIDSICEHLELDSRMKTLKLFRFPSVCMTLCANSADNTTWMEKLFSSAMSDLNDERELKSAHFFREVVYSYAIFFAQSKYSRSKFKNHQLCERSKLPDHNHDPLLERLSTQEWSTALIDDLGLGEVKLSYKPETDFPFFARRLEILQEYSIAQAPNSVWTLWKDRRDLNRFYTLWAALIFGVAALSMGLIQIFLSIAQVVAGFATNRGK